MIDLSSKGKYKRVFNCFLYVMQHACAAPQMLFQVKPEEKQDWLDAMAIAQDAGFLAFNAQPKDKNGGILLNHILMISNIKSIFDEVRDGLAKSGHRNDGPTTMDGNNRQHSDRPDVVGGNTSSPEVGAGEKPANHMDTGQAGAAEDFITEAMS